MLTMLVVSSPDRRDATLSFNSTREPISPLNRCAKNSIGSASTCHKKPLEDVNDSLVSSRNSDRCCRYGAAALQTAVIAIASHRGLSHLTIPPTRDRKSVV